MTPGQKGQATKARPKGPQRPDQKGHKAGQKGHKPGQKGQNQAKKAITRPNGRKRPFGPNLS